MQHTRLLLLLAALSFIPTLFFYSVGEEGIYTISTMEMWQSRNWFIETMYGINLQRPPLMNWLGVGIANLLGWTHVLHSIRLLSIAATLGMAAWLYWLSARLFADRSFAAFAALACLAMADLALYRGWLAYTDPLFAFFTFGAMASLWVAALEKHKGWLLASVLLVSCALLTKAFTAYVFYATVGFVLLWRQETR
ncbi:MAG: dolichyl-phosphate-mannose--protein mannosyltransferase, partial [Gallionellales bacterium CG_4_10_14_3_um_filter_54_96]